MNKRGWLIPVLIVIANILAVVTQWGSLPELLPAHFDLQGNAGGTMSRNTLLLYLLVSAAVYIAAYAVAHAKHKLQTGLNILASGICLIMLFSTLVTLTHGTIPIFMIAEPIIILTAIIGFVACVVKSRKKQKLTTK